MKDHIIGRVVITEVKKEERVTVNRYWAYQEMVEKRMKTKEEK